MQPPQPSGPRQSPRSTPTPGEEPHARRRSHWQCHARLSPWMSAAYGTDAIVELHFDEPRPLRAPFHLHDNVDRLAQQRLDVLPLERAAALAFANEQRQHLPRHRTIVGMDGGDHAGMTRRYGAKEVVGAAVTQLGKDYAVRPHPKGCFHQRL